MIKAIKIVQSPFNPSLEVVEDIVINLHVPYSDTNVSIQVNPNIQEYQENANTKDAQVRQVMVTTPTDETIAGSDYEIELTNIGKENIQGQDFPFFEFNVSKG